LPSARDGLSKAFAPASDLAKRSELGVDDQVDNLHRRRRHCPDCHCHQDRQDLLVCMPVGGRLSGFEMVNGCAIGRIEMIDETGRCRICGADR